MDETKIPVKAPRTRAQVKSIRERRMRKRQYRRPVPVLDKRVRELLIKGPPTRKPPTPPKRRPVPVLDKRVDELLKQGPPTRKPPMPPKRRPVPILVIKKPRKPRQPKKIKHCEKLRSKCIAKANMVRKDKRILKSITTAQSAIVKNNKKIAVLEAKATKLQLRINKSKTESVINKLKATKSKHVSGVTKNTNKNKLLLEKIALLSKKL